MASLMEVVLEQTYANQQCINRWNYLASGVPAAVTYSFALASAMGAIYDAVAVPPEYPDGGLMKLISAVQNDAVTFESLTVKNVYVATDFYSTLFVNPLTGADGGTGGTSPVNAFGFFSSRVRQDIKRGTKRFVGVSSGAVSDLGMINPAMNANLQAIADAMSDVLTYNDEGNIISFAPVIVKRESYVSGQRPDGSDRHAYRYRSEATQFDFLAEGIFWNYYPQTRSQTSRQYGKGR